MTKKIKLNVTHLLSKNNESTEPLDYQSEYYNPFTGLQFPYFSEELATSVDFVLKMLDKDIPVCKFYPNFRVMYLQLQKFIKQLEQDERYEECAIIQKYIKQQQDLVPKSLIETKFELEKYNESNKIIPSEDIFHSLKDIPNDIITLYNFSFIVQIIDNFWLWNEDMSLTQEFLEKGITYPEHMAQEIFNIYINNYKSRFYGASIY